jgi:beta-galactosidase
MYMKIQISIFVLFLFFAAGCSPDTQKDVLTQREVRKFTDEWRFSPGDTEGASMKDFDDSMWEVLDLPHDWSITEPYHADNPGGGGTSYMIGGIGWYRKSFLVPENQKDKRFEITFDGVYQNSTVWINGHELGTRPFGYITFKYDLTPYVIPGAENLIAVRVDNSDQPNSRWYSGSGIYRNVWLTGTDKAYIEPWELFITTPSIDEKAAVVNIRSMVRNLRDESIDGILLSEIFNPSGTLAASVQTPVQVEASGEIVVQQEVTVNSPGLWSVEDPNLYKVKQTLLNGSIKIDDYVTSFGIRYFHFDPYKGFFLNGEQVKIKGVCMHHDLGALGAAVNVRAMERQLEILRGMGVNAIRTAHNPPAPELLQLCDRMGFIVMNETFDEWKMNKTRHGYSVFWDEWHEQDLRDHIMRDRNHPSVMIWSIGNEILEQWHAHGSEMTLKLASIVRELDPTRPITAGNNDPAPHNSLIKSGALDLIGYNYKHQDYEKFHDIYPGKAFIATETTSALATRGSYDMPSDSIRRWPYRWDQVFTDGNADNTCSAYDNCSAPWGSTHEETWKVVRKHDFMSGMFIWTGFDYLGEPTPYNWPSRSSFFGVVDLAGFPKDAYYLYQSEWTNEKVLHVFPHWNWQPGQQVDIWAWFNHADEVELYLNGVSQGVKTRSGDDLHVGWRLDYEPGVLKAVSRKNGKTILEKEIKTAGTPARMQVKADRTRLSPGGDDLSFITIEMLDAEGNPVPLADNLVKIEVKGKASIAGVDNGNQNSHEPFQTNQINAFNGKCLAIIRAGKTSGQAQVTFSSAGLPDQTVSLSIR